MSCLFASINKDDPDNLCHMSKQVSVLEHFTKIVVKTYVTSHKKKENTALISGFQNSNIMNYHRLTEVVRRSNIFNDASQYK